VTVLLDAQPAGGGNRATLPGLPPGAVAAFANQGNGASISPATIVLVIAVLGMVFVGLVAAAGFTVMAQRRLRALGMISALGATERNVRLVMTITAATAGALGLLGAVLGTAGAMIAGLAWAHSSVTVTFGHVPLLDYLLLLAALPAAAAAGGWLLAGRDPARISRQPLE
jgi:putative ABC transport system permease protein